MLLISNIAVLFWVASVVRSAGVTVRKGATPLWVIRTVLGVTSGPLIVKDPVLAVICGFGVALTVITSSPLPPHLLTVSQLMLLLIDQLIFDEIVKAG